MNHRMAPWVAIGVMLLAVLLAVADTGETTRATATHAWTAAVEAGQDHISPEALAAMLQESPGGLLLVDVRLPEEFAWFHLPGAVNLDLTQLLGPQGTALLDAATGKTVVLLSNGMTHPAQAWVALTEAGRTNVRILEDGLDGFIARVLTPPSMRGATTERRARAEAADFAALRQQVLAAAPTSAVGAAPATEAR